MIRRSTVLFLLTFQIAFFSDALAESERAELGLIAPINGRYELVEVRQQIPWSKGVCEPWFGVYLRFATSQEHRLMFRVLRQDPNDGSYQQIQEDPEWAVTEGAVLTGEVDFSAGYYRHVVTIDNGTPLECKRPPTTPSPAPIRHRTLRICRWSAGCRCIEEESSGRGMWARRVAAV